MATKENPKPMPVVVQDYIDNVVAKMLYRKNVRADVRAELEAHFEDALADCPEPKEREALAKELIAGFGDARILAKLIRRAKKRCRPLWAKVLVRTGQVAGLFVVYVLLYAGYLHIGSPTIAIDFVARLNEEAKQGRDESLNAYPGVARAVAQLEPLPKLIDMRQSYEDMNDVARRSFDEYLVRNETAFNELVTAVKKPYYWRQYDSVSPGTGDTALGLMQNTGAVGNLAITSNLMSQIMEELPKYRQMTFVLRDRVERSCVQGNTEGALDDAVTILRFGRLVTQAVSLVEQLVGVAVMAMGQGTLMEVLERSDLSEPLLAEAYAVLVQYSDWDRPWLYPTMDEVVVEDLIQRSFTDDGHGGGRPLASGALGFFRESGVAGWAKTWLVPGYPDRKQVTEHVDCFFKDLLYGQTVTPWERRDEEFALSNTGISMSYTDMTRPALGRVEAQTWRAKIGCQAMLTVLAIKRYQLRHGRLPQALDAVVADGLLKELPRDFYAPGPLTYRQMSDTQFILYSRGQDLKDDGGTPSTSRNGKSKEYGPRGDWIFWPRR